MIKKISKILSTKQKLSFAMLTVLLFIGGLFDLMGVSFIMPIFNLAMDENSLQEHRWIMLLQDIFRIDDARHVVIILISLMIIVYIVKNVYIVIMYKVLFYYTYKFKRELAMRMMKCYMYQDYTFHLEKNVADLQRNILTDTGMFFGFISDFMNMFNQSIVCILLAGYLLLVDWQTAVGVFVVLGGGMLIIYRYQRKRQVERGIANREAAADLNKWIIQSFNGIKEIQVMGREKYFLERCESAYIRGMDANKKSNFSAIVPKPIMEAVCVSGLLGIVLVRLLLGAELSQFVSVLAVFAVAAFRMLPCFNSISAYVSNMLFEKESVDAVYDDIVEMEKLGEKNNMESFSEKIGLKKKIEIRDLTYQYPKSTKQILKNVSIEIEKNTSVGFMGASGAGKSTLIDILLGILPITQGQVLVDGIDIKDNIVGWHKIVGYIPQSIYLIDDTIRRNVAFGISDENISDEQVWNALEEAQIADYVRSLKKGLDSEIGDRGIRISGGQRQRLGIARALYSDPQVLVFDEATSALDNETEAALMEAIDGLKGKRTMLIIAHRLNTIEKCDAIYEIADGKAIKR